MNEKQELQDFRESIAAHAKVTPGKWDKVIADIEEFLRTNTNVPIRIVISPVLIITNVRNFIIKELEVVTANNGVETYQPYLNRILAVIENVKKWQNER